MRLSSTQKDVLFILYAIEAGGKAEPVPCKNTGDDQLSSPERYSWNELPNVMPHAGGEWPVEQVPECFSKAGL